MLTKDQVTNVAHLARIKLTDSEIDAMTTQLGAILHHFEEISKVDTTDVEPLITPIEIHAELRADEVERFENAGELLLANCSDRQGNLFKVPPVVG